MVMASSLHGEPAVASVAWPPGEGAGHECAANHPTHCRDDRASAIGLGRRPAKQRVVFYGLCHFKVDIDQIKLGLKLAGIDFNNDVVRAEVSRLHGIVYPRLFDNSDTACAAAAAILRDFAK
jgi:hypothetical protein